MARKAPRPCRKPGCPALTNKGSLCEKHRREGEAAYNRSRPKGYATRYGKDWHEIRERFLRANPICEHLTCNEPATEVDHITSLKLGGTNALHNLRGYCKRHHSQKTALVDGRWG